MNVLDFYDRARAGKRVTEQEFDLKILPAKLKELIKKYEIKRNPDDVVPQDLDMAKRVFDAGAELLTGVGVHCKDTQSIITIEEEEIMAALKEAPARHVLGEGAEAVECYSRGIGDKRRPIQFGGTNGMPMSQENYMDIMASHAREPIDGIHTGALQTLFGRTVRAGEPVELMACQYEALWTREAVRRAGKPGMSILGVMSGVSSEVQDATDFPGGLRPSDLHLVAFSNELKANWQDLKKIVHNQNLGNTIESCCVPVLGGYCGGPEGAAITAVAEAMQGFVMTKSMTFGTFTSSLRFGAANRQSLWVSCMLPLAFISAGMDLLLTYYIVATAGPCTEMLCDELATMITAATASGYSTLQGGVGCQGNNLDHSTGMEARISSELARAAAGIGLDKANEIAKEPLRNYEETLKSRDVPQGKSFTECYQDRLKPGKEYLALWEKKKKELEKMGLAFS